MKNQFQAFFLTFLILTSPIVNVQPLNYSNSSINPESPPIEGIENSSKDTSTIQKEMKISFPSKSRGIAPGKSCKNKPTGCDINLGCSTEKEYTCQDCAYKLGLFKIPDTGKTIKLPNRNCQMSDHCCPNEYCLIVKLGTCKPCKWDTGPSNTKDKTTKCKRDYECCSGLCKADSEGGDKYCLPCQLLGSQCSEDRDCCSRKCNGTCTDGPVFRCKHILMSCSSVDKCCSELLCKSGVCTEPPEEKPACMNITESCNQGQECCSPNICKSGSCQENCNSEGFDCKSVDCCSPFICNKKKICEKPKSCLNKNEACKNETLQCCSGLNCFPDSNGSNYTCQSTPPCMNELVSCDGDEENSGNQICCSKSNLRCFGGECRICNKPNIPCKVAKDCCGVLKCIDDPIAGKVCMKPPPKKEPCYKVQPGEKCNNDQNDISLICEGKCISGKCYSIKMKGELCQENSYIWCHDSECKNQKCIKYVGIGEDCDEKTFIFCNIPKEYDGKCQGVGQKKICVVNLKLGEYCNEESGFICGTGMKCHETRKICYIIVKLGELCWEISSSECDTGLVCDGITKNCVKFIDEIGFECLNKPYELCNHVKPIYCLNGKCGTIQTGCVDLCEEPLICGPEGYCIYKVCDTGSTVEKGFACVYGIVLKITVNEIGGACISNNDCYPGLGCHKGHCMTVLEIELYNKCDEFRFCPFGSFCVNGKCVECVDCGGKCNYNNGDLCDTTTNQCIITKKTPKVCPKIKCNEPLTLNSQTNSCEYGKYPCPVFEEPKIDKKDCTQVGCQKTQACHLPTKKCVTLVFELGGTCDEGDGQVKLYCAHPLQCQNNKCVRISFNCNPKGHIHCPIGSKCNISPSNYRGVCYIDVKYKESCDKVRYLCPPPYECISGWCLKKPLKKKECEKLECNSPDIKEGNTCYKVVKIGDPCNGENIRCPSYLTCDPDYKKCLKYSDATCDDSKLEFCYKGMKCNGGVCIYIDFEITIGDQCSKIKPCKEPLFCNFLVNLCAIEVKIGQECDQVLKVCGKDLFCNYNGICVKVVGKNEVCNEERLCAPGLFCDSRKKICVIFIVPVYPKIPDEVGEGCDNCCKKPLICDPIRNVCVRKAPDDELPPISPDDPEAEEAPTCSCLDPDCKDQRYTCDIAKEICVLKEKIPTPGRPCGSVINHQGKISKYDQECHFGGKCVDAVCVYTVADGECDGKYRICRTGFKCSKFRRVCIPDSVPEGLCDPLTNNCPPKYRCSPSLDKCIQDKPRVGDNCGPGQYICDFPYLCVDGQCAEAVNIGQSCSCGQVCIGGSYCQPKTFKCVEVLPPGSICDENNKVCDPSLSLSCQVSPTGGKKRCIKIIDIPNTPCDGMNVFCLSPLACIGGSCLSPLPRPGESCKDSEGKVKDCLKGTCDPKYFICIIDVGPGEVCDEFIRVCPNEYECKNCPFPDAISNRNCVKNGEPCPSELKCRDGATLANDKCLVGLGGACDNSIYICNGSELQCSSGFCVKILQIAEICDIQAFLICDKGLHCLGLAGNKSVCSVIQDIGENCNSQGGYICRQGLFCFDQQKKVESESGICFQKIGIGKNCQGGGKICFPSNLGCGRVGICQETRDIGLECDGFNTICKNNLQCIDGFCIKWSSKGEVCEKHKSLCKVESNLICKDSKCYIIAKAGEKCGEEIFSLCPTGVECSKDLGFCVEYVEKGFQCDSQFKICRDHEIKCQILPGTQERYCLQLRKFTESCSKKDFDFCETGFDCHEKVCSLFVDLGDNCLVESFIYCKPNKKLRCNRKTSKCENESKGEQELEDDTDIDPNQDICRRNPGFPECKDLDSQINSKSKIDGKQYSSLGLGSSNKGGNGGISHLGGTSNNQIEKRFRFKEKPSIEPLRIHLPCRSDGDCFTGLICDKAFKVCKLHDQEMKECQTNDDCGEGMKCFQKLKENNEWKSINEPMNENCSEKSNKSHSNNTNEIPEIFAANSISEIALCLFDKSLSEGKFCLSSVECLNGLSCLKAKDNLNRCLKMSIQI